MTVKQQQHPSRYQPHRFVDSFNYPYRRMWHSRNANVSLTHWPVFSLSKKEVGGGGRGNNQRDARRFSCEGFRVSVIESSFYDHLGCATLQMGRFCRDIKMIRQFTVLQRSKEVLILFPHAMEKLDNFEMNSPSHWAKEGLRLKRKVLFRVLPAYRLLKTDEGGVNLWKDRSNGLKKTLDEIFPA